MPVRVLFFGATAATMGCRELSLDVGDAVTAGDLFRRLLDQNPALASHKLLFSVNQEYAVDDRRVEDGDELAVFTAVSGG